MLSNNKKLSENTQATALCSGTVVHGRRFHHAHVQMPGIKTAAQRKEYPPHVHKAENNPVMLSHGQGGDHVMKKTEDSESYVEPEVKRKVQQKRHCSTYQLSPLSPASKKCLTHFERDGSVVKSTHCSFRGTETSCKHPNRAPSKHL